MLDPPPPGEVLDAAGRLSHRAFIIVGLIVAREDLFPDQWIYIHSPAVRVGRIQNFKNWSPAMVPDSRMTSIGMEYFCDEGDATWAMPDAALIDLASRELADLGLAPGAAVTDGCVWRQPGAYPVYTDEYQRHLGVIRGYLAGLANLQTVGRNGMHRYNNMDQAMLVGILAAENVGGARHDLWEFNEESAYLEESPRTQVAPDISRSVLARAFARMDKLAFATAAGAVSGLLFFLATAWLVIKGGSPAGPNLALLGQYFKGYAVTPGGALVAGAYGFLTGFVFGWLFAFFRNLFLALHLAYARRRAELMTVRDFFDNL